MNEHRAIPKFYYVADSYGVPDGKRMLSSVSCSCGERMNHVRTEYVDCGTVSDYECPQGHTQYVDWNLIENC